MKLCQTAKIRYGRVAKGHFWSKSMSLDPISEDNLVFICKGLLSVSKKTLNFLKLVLVPKF